ncbi:MAG: anti-sigma factor [Gemmatimonadota bacterium]
MTAHEWFIEHRTEYAARVLDAEDSAAFAAHMVHCDACRSAVARIEAELEWLPMGATPVTPRAEFEGRVLAHAIGRSASPWRRWALPIGMAASLLSGLAGWKIGQAKVVVSPLSVAAVATDTTGLAQLAALRDTLSIMRTAARVMQATITMQGKEGGMVIFADPVTHRWNVVVHGLPKAPVDGRYQFWFIRSDGMVRGAEVQVDPTRPMIFTTGMPPGDGEILGAALTIEPMEGRSASPQGRELAHVML